MYNTDELKWIAQSSGQYTEDVDVAAPPSVSIEICKCVQAGVLNFVFEPDGKIAFDAPHGFRVRIDLIEIGSGCIKRIHVSVSFYTKGLSRHVGHVTLEGRDGGRSRGTIRK